METPQRPWLNTDVLDSRWGDRTERVGCILLATRKSKLEILMSSLSHGNTKNHLSLARALKHGGSAGAQLERVQ